MTDRFKGVPSDFEYKGIIYILDRNVIKPNGGPQLNYRLLRYVPAEGLEDIDFWVKYLNFDKLL